MDQDPSAKVSLRLDIPSNLGFSEEAKAECSVTLTQINGMYEAGLLSHEKANECIADAYRRHLFASRATEPQAKMAVELPRGFDWSVESLTAPHIIKGYDWAKLYVKPSTTLKSVNAAFDGPNRWDTLRGRAINAARNNTLTPVERIIASHLVFSKDREKGAFHLANMVFGMIPHADVIPYHNFVMLMEMKDDARISYADSVSKSRLPIFPPLRDGDDDLNATLMDGGEGLLLAGGPKRDRFSPRVGKSSSRSRRAEGSRKVTRRKRSRSLSPVTSQQQHGVCVKNVGARVWSKG